MRQQGNGQLAFRRALEGLRNNALNYYDQQVLASRIASILNAQDRRFFNNTTCIYFRNEDVRDCNERRLRETNNLVLRLKARYNNPTVGSRASINKCSQLEDEIEVAIGCRIMLLANIQTKTSLVNSTTGYLYDIEQPLGTTDPRSTLPQALIFRIKRDSYSSPILKELDNSLYITVPLFRTKRMFYRRGQEHQREQFPIRVAFAITVHKAQGIILDKAVVDITIREFTSGLRYVAVSRVKTINTLMFEKPFDFLLFTNSLGGAGLVREANIKRRQSERLLPDNTSDYNTQDTYLRSRQSTPNS